MTTQPPRPLSALAPARRGGKRRLTFDNGRHEDYDSVFVQHPGGEWDRILIARDDGTIAQALADAINAAARDSAGAGLDAERLRWAKWISEVGDLWPFVAQGDWACAECRPTSDLIDPGWRCVIHEARARLSAAPPVPE